ncbi:autophagocytosis associated protein [Leucosporidium creatinivorum]|uniref:Autophagy-related protein 3 n=1 Tax=Leucosporidium creatinivorum TaxID=106004 RepID=A0A1Y2FRY1_9BASI|nr:autophagocytosis associated protein [Leucosporidium creatinivorum]
MLGSIQTQFWTLRDYLSPVLLHSKFKESGRITPEEFVAAGDYLVYKFPTWSWESGEEGRRREYLPQDKQFLVQRNVPCLRRVSQLAYGGGLRGAEDGETMISFAEEAAAAAGGADDEEDWVATHTTGKDGPTPSSAPIIGDIPDDAPPSSQSLSSQFAATSLGGGGGEDKEEMPDLDDIPDMSDDEDEGLGGGGVVEEEDEAALKEPVAEGTSSNSDNLIQVRTYDCSITYDKYYQTPRMWLLGYDESRTPLPPTTALQDVSTDHAQKTVTIEPFPHSSSLSMASVHPCKHSSVMKKVIERMDGAVRRAQLAAGEGQGVEGGKEGKEKGRKWGILGKKKDGTAAVAAEGAKEGAAAGEQEGPEGLRVDQYLVVFLKFMSSIVPTIEVDATNSI